MVRCVKACIISVLLMIPLAGCSRGQEKGKPMYSLSINYFPIDADTLTPVTSQNIRRRGKIIIIQDDFEIKTIKEIIESRNNNAVAVDHFRDKIVRAKVFEIIHGDKKLIAIIEADGVCKLGDNRVVEIPQQSLEKLKNLIEKYLK